VRLPKRKNRVRLWLGALCGWVLYGLFNGTQTYVTRLTLGNINWRLVYSISLLDALLWACLTPLILRVARMLSPTRIGWPAGLIAQLAASIAFTFLHLFIFVKLLPQVGYYPVGRQSLFMVQLQNRLQYDMLTYWLLIGMRQALEFYRQFRARELKASQLETTLIETRLQVLRMQLQPHFLFNTMNTISSLMYKDVPAADRVLNRLAGFLRLTLETERSQEISLQMELEYMDRYLDIEMVRFGDRLRVTREIAPDTLAALVPTLILQPLVENAIRHGVAARANAGKMWIRARREDDALLVEVEDDGEAPLEIKEGVGLGNARSRLGALYGGEQRLFVGQGNNGGFRVAMRIPYRIGEQA
jgi:two-component system LytT family sensor kinase